MNNTPYNICTCIMISDTPCDLECSSTGYYLICAHASKFPEHYGMPYIQFTMVSTHISFSDLFIILDIILTIHICGLSYTLLIYVYMYKENIAIHNLEHQSISMFVIINISFDCTPGGTYILKTCKYLYLNHFFTYYIMHFGTDKC